MAKRTKKHDTTKITIKATPEGKYELIQTDEFGYVLTNKTCKTYNSALQQYDMLVENG